MKSEVELQTLKVAALFICVVVLTIENRTLVSSACIAYMVMLELIFGDLALFPCSQHQATCRYLWHYSS